MSGRQLIGQQPEGYDLDHHGDQDARPGLVDLAVNVRRPGPPAWLAAELAAEVPRLGSYPDPTRATVAVAARHGRPADQVLLTAGAAEAFTLLARALRPAVDVRRPTVVHPQFTEPEAALRRAGHVVHRVLTSPDDGFALHPESVPESADLVIVGNPTNPTSILHPAATVSALARPGRVLVVDEAFMDAVPAEAESVASVVGPPGVVVVRSLTKTWGLAGLRVGYLLGPADLLARCRAVQPPWAVSSLGLRAAELCCGSAGVAEAERAAASDGSLRDRLVQVLSGYGGQVCGAPAAPFVLARFGGGELLREALRRKGFAVRGGDTFPGLGPDWLRFAVRGHHVLDGLRDALGQVASAGQIVAG
jgi:histidinol-phosphate aminotransferase